MTTCECGLPATCERQTGWDAARNCGVYASLCEACYAETPEAARHAYDSRVQEAAASLGITSASRIIVEAGAYGRHPRADEILLAMRG